MSDLINNHEELFEHVGEDWDPADVEGSEKRLSRHVYKSTDCGAWAKLEAPATRKVGETTERWTFVYRTANNEGSLLLGLCIRGEDWFHSSDLHKDVRDWANPPGFTKEELDKIRAGENGVIRMFAMSQLTAIEADVPVGVYEPVSAGVSCGSIVEGSDAEVGPVTLRYPFPVADWDAMLEGVEKDVDDLWEEANGDDEDGAEDG